MKHVLRPGQTDYQTTCHECGCVFTYERSDVHHNYARGGEWVSCPSCGRDCGHMGAYALGRKARWHAGPHLVVKATVTDRIQFGLTPLPRRYRFDPHDGRSLEEQVAAQCRKPS